MTWTKSHTPRHQLLTGLPPEAALGHAVALLMRHPVFATVPFGHIARSLAGQVNRGHYAFVARGRAMIGFLGWARATEALAEAWLAGTRPLGDAEARSGAVALVNFLRADDPEVTRFLLARLPELMPGARMLVARRFYPDGRVRHVRLRLPADYPERN